MGKCFQIFLIYFCILTFQNAEASLNTCVDFYNSGRFSAIHKKFNFDFKLYENYRNLISNSGKLNFPIPRSSLELLMAIVDLSSKLNPKDLGFITSIFEKGSVEDQISLFKLFHSFGHADQTILQSRVQLLMNRLAKQIEKLDSSDAPYSMNPISDRNSKTDLRRLFYTEIPTQNIMTMFSTCCNVKVKPKYLWAVESKLTNSKNLLRIPAIMALKSLEYFVDRPISLSANASTLYFFGVPFVPHGKAVNAIRIPNYLIDLVTEVGFEQAYPEIKEYYRKSIMIDKSLNVVKSIYYGAMIAILSHLTYVSAPTLAPLVKNSVEFEMSSRRTVIADSDYKRRQQLNYYINGVRNIEKREPTPVEIEAEWATLVNTPDFRL